jgi:hypothetical protein
LFSPWRKTQFDVWQLKGIKNYQQSEKKQFFVASRKAIEKERKKNIVKKNL